MVEVVSSPQQNTKQEVGNPDTAPVLPNTREVAFRQIGELVKAARAAVAGAADPLDVRASKLEAQVSQLGSGPTSLAQAQGLLAEVKNLENETRSTLASQRNPWGIRASAAQESQRFNQVVTLSVPRGQALQMEYHRARVNGCTERGAVRIQGTCSGMQTSAGRVWRQPDPSKPGFDTITVATYERHCEQTRCGGVQREAFRGYLTFKQPCGGPAFHVNVNNGRNNDHLSSREGIPAVDLSPEALVSQDTAPPSRSYDDVELTPSPSDDWRGAGFNSFEEYLASFEQPNEESVAMRPIAAQREHFRVVLKPGETLYAYRDSSLEGTLSYAGNNSEQVTHIGLDAAQARFSRELPNGSREYEIEPGSSKKTRPLHFKIIRAGGGPDGLGFESLAEARVYLEPSEGVLRSASAEVSTGVLASAESDETRGVDMRAQSQVVLPEAGSCASPTRPLTIQLGTGALQFLNIYEVGGSNVGTIFSTARENSWELARGAIRIERDRSAGAPPNRLLLYAGTATESRAFNLSVVSAATVESLGKTKITVGPDAPASRPQRDSSEKFETQYAIGTIPARPVQRTGREPTGVSATPTAPRLVVSSTEREVASKGAHDTSVPPNSGIVRPREGSRRPILGFLRPRGRR